MDFPPAVHIIDDDDAVRDSMAILLEANGYAVATYASGGEYLEDRAAGPVGCVVTDIQMPGPDGLELLRQLKAVDPHLPVIVVTGGAEWQLKAQALARGADAFIQKPFAPGAFVAAVRGALTRLAC